MIKVPVFFVGSKSNYKLAAVFDCYDIKRGFDSYQGSDPAIFHPPCRLFSRLRKSSTAPACEKLLAYWAVVYTRSNGGIIEHPASSTLFKEMGLPLPWQGPDKYGGYTVMLEQIDFGCPVPKRTWLYICGVPSSELPDIPFYMKIPMRRKIVDLSPVQRSLTPVLFCSWLYQVLLKVRKPQCAVVNRAIEAL